MKRKPLVCACLMSALLLPMWGCHSAPTTSEQTEVAVFAAASLESALTQIAQTYEAQHEDVKLTFTFDSSGTLKTQIEEGAVCDLFLSAAQKQMDDLEADGLMVEGTRANVVNNQVVVITLKDSGTKVTGLENLNEAESIALAGGSVPVGRYTRQALVNLGTLPETDDPASITTQEVSDALGGVEISEQDNVSKVLTAVVEGSCEVGTTYYSDTYGYEDDIDILQTVSYAWSTRKRTTHRQRRRRISLPLFFRMRQRQYLILIILIRM